MTRNRKVVAALLAIVLIAGAGYLGHRILFAPKTITAYFTTATAIYPGDEVRVAGVKVGTIDAIGTDGTSAKLTLHIDHARRIPADAKAVIVAPNLISARYVQLAPAFRRGEPEMPDGATIPIERTAVPVEWDEVKTQLTRLATELGPKDNGTGVSESSVSKFIDSAANAMDGNGEKLHQTISQLSSIARVLAEGSGDIVATIGNLQKFVTTLRSSNTQIVSFQNRLATLSQVLDGSRSDIDEALTTLSSAIDDVKRFVAGTRNQTSEQIQRLANVTQTLADHRADLENLLHAAPNQLANAYNIYNPDSGAVVGSFAFQNFSNPVTFICSSIGAIENATASESAKLCSQYLGPALRLLNFNYLPFPVSPILAKSPSPDRIVYTDPALAPGGSGAPPGPAEVPPAVSAYTGAGDVPPPPGWDLPPRPPGAYAPNGLPADPSPALYPGAPIPPGVPAAAPPSPTALPDLLLPAEGAPPAPSGPSDGAATP